MHLDAFPFDTPRLPGPLTPCTSTRPHSVQATSPVQCGPQFALLVGANASDPAPVWQPAAGALVTSSTLRLTAATAGVVLASAYGRGNYPLISLYAAGGLPVLPWCFTLGRPVDVACYAANFTTVPNTLVIEN